MKKSTLLMKKCLHPTFLALILSLVIVPVGTVSPIPTITQTNPTTTIFFDPPTINGTAVGVNNTKTVNLMIRDAPELGAWQAGLIFNPTLLSCTGYFEGGFFSSAGEITWNPGIIDNVAGVITFHAATLKGDDRANGSGRLAYLNFKVKGEGVSDLHLRDVKISNIVYNGAPKIIYPPFNIIDVYTVVLDGTPHKVVTVSDSTRIIGTMHSGFYDHAFNEVLEELSFKVTGPYQGFSNVTIPQALLKPKNESYGWGVIIDGNRLSFDERTITENATHTSIYFIYSSGVHSIQITTRFLSSTVPITLSSTTVNVGSDVNISGGINPVRAGVNVTIEYRPSGGVWTTLATVPTDLNGNYSYTWTPEIIRIYEFKASWEGDEYTLGNESDPPYPTLTVQPIPPSIYVFEVDGVYVVIESNSTVSDFAFNQTLNEISFDVTGLHGVIYFSNVTVPGTLMWTDNLDEWAVTIDGKRLGTGERTVTYNATHSSIYFTYTPGVHKIQITTRFVVSTISIALSSPSVIVGSNITLSGDIDPVRPSVNVTIRYRPIGETDWLVLANVTTDLNGNYSYMWTPEMIEPYEFKASWEGDDYALGDESDPPYPTLTVQPISASEKVEEVVWEGQVFYIIIESNSTISNFDFSRPDKQISFNVTGPYGVIYFSNVTIPEELLGSPYIVYVDDGFVIPTKTENETHASLYFTYSSGTHEVEINGFFVIQETSTISITLSPTSVTVGSNVIISGGIDPVRANVTVELLYRLSGETAWSSLANVTTNQNSNYTYTWTPQTAGTYEVSARWNGDDFTKSDESDSPYPTLTVEAKGKGIPLEIIAAAVGATIIIGTIGAVGVYFVKFRKPKPV